MRRISLAAGDASTAVTRQPSFSRCAVSRPPPAPTSRASPGVSNIEAALMRRPHAGWPRVACRKRFHTSSSGLNTWATMPRNDSAARPFTDWMRRLRMVLAAVAVLSTACTSSTTAGAVTPRPSPSTTQKVAAPAQLCFTNPPADWAAAMAKTVATLDGINFGAGAVDDQNGVVYGGTFSSSGNKIVGVDLSTGKMTVTANMPSSGFAWMSFGDGWLAWPQSGLGGSSIQLWNSGTRQRSQIVTGGPAQAVVDHGDVVWSEAVDGQSNAIPGHQLASREQAPPAAGRVRPPRLARRSP